MKHNADTIVSLFMSELLHDTTALAGMTPTQRAILDTVCRTAAEDALALSGSGSPVPEPEQVLLPQLEFRPFCVSGQA